MSPDSPVVVIRASTGEQHLIFAELEANTDDPAEQAFIIRPMVQFERGERYIVALRNMRDASGEVLEAPEVFRAFRDDTLTDNDAIEAAARIHGGDFQRSRGCRCRPGRPLPGLGFHCRQRREHHRAHSAHSR